MSNPPLFLSEMGHAMARLNQVWLGGGAIGVLCMTALVIGCRTRSPASAPLVANPTPTNKMDANLPVGIMAFFRDPSCKNNERMVSTCGGSRIGSTTILTAAQCIASTQTADKILVWKNVADMRRVYPHMDKSCANLDAAGWRAVAAQKDAYLSAVSVRLFKQFMESYPANYSLAQDLATLKIDDNIPQFTVKLNTEVPTQPSNEGESAKRPLFIVGPGTNDCVSPENPRAHRLQNARKMGLGRAVLREVSAAEFDAIAAGLGQSDLNHNDWEQTVKMLPVDSSVGCPGDTGSGLFEERDGEYFVFGPYAWAASLYTDQDKVVHVVTDPPDNAPSSQLSFFATVQSPFACALLASDEDVTISSPEYAGFCQKLSGGPQPIEIKLGP